MGSDAPFCHVAICANRVLTYINKESVISGQFGPITWPAVVKERPASLKLFTQGHHTEAVI